jgi:hypothetical protein
LDGGKYCNLANISGGPSVRHALLSGDIAVLSERRGQIFPDPGRLRWQYTCRPAISAACMMDARYRDVAAVGCVGREMEALLSFEARAHDTERA